uniref:Uncharacterized protein LOC104212341 n=1 Tax=Nicotiana sylvestris TaxID=4096 RepID=A0A1U7VDG3_NICSY|nr:PREDICTED: uncharacterized protein LOC104212341 [Nicotiana sylvestris]
MDLMNCVFKSCLDSFVIVFVDDILIYSHNREEHGQYLWIVLQTLRENQLYAKISKCEFWLDSVSFLGHVVSEEGIKVDPKKIKEVQNWSRPTSAIEIRSFLGLASYYYWFMEALANHFVRLDVSEPSPVLACIVARSSLYESIRERQYDDPKLHVLRDIVQHGGSKQGTVGDDGVLRMYGHICITNMDVIQWLAEIYIREIVCLHGVPVSIISNQVVREVHQLGLSHLETHGRSAGVHTPRSPLPLSSFTVHFIRTIVFIPDSVL